MNRTEQKDMTTVLDYLAGFDQPTRVKEAVRRLTKPRRPPRKSLAPGKTKAQRKTERNDRARKIRAAVFARAAGRCEFCKRRPPAEWHHIIGGGERTAKESEETTAAVCVECHDLWEAADPVTFMRAVMWANERGFREARHEIQHRAWKGNEARAATTRKETL